MHTRMYGQDSSRSSSYYRQQACVKTNTALCLSAAPNYTQRESRALKNVEKSTPWTKFIEIGIRQASKYDLSQIFF